MKKRIFNIVCLIYLCMFAFNTIVLAENNNFNCQSFAEIKVDLQNFFNFFKIIVPLLVIGLSTYDFIKAITAKDDNDIKKSFTRLIKRLVYAVILFFLPVILNFLMNLVTDNVCIDEIMK